MKSLQSSAFISNKNHIIKSFILTTLLVLALSILSIVVLFDLYRSSYNIYNHPLKVTQSTKAIQHNVISIHRDMKDIVLSTNTQELQKYSAIIQSTQKEVFKNFETVFNHYLGPKSDLSKSYELFKAWEPIRQEVITLVGHHKYKEAIHITKNRGAKHVEKLFKSIDTMVLYAQNKANYFIQEANKTKKRYLTIIIAITVIIIWTIFIISKKLLSKLYTDEKLRLKNERLAIQQSRMAQMGELISMIAHQWRQPLSSIGAISSSIQLNKSIDDDSCNDDILDKANKIDILVTKLSQTINDFRNFYKPDKETETVSLKKLIIDSLAIIQPSLQNIKIHMDVKKDTSLPLFTHEVEHVVLNIVKNAYDNFKEKSTPSPEVTITLSDHQVTICDNGGGIPPEIMENIFNPYFSTKEEKNGTGLGLYMSKTIIEDHHQGKLNVFNTDIGVCFELVFNPDFNSQV